MLSLALRKNYKPADFIRRNFNFTSFNFYFLALKVDIHDREFIPDDFENNIFISTDVSAPPIAYNVCCDAYQNK